MTYIVQATVTIITKSGWRSSVQIPTFFLDDDMQWIEHLDHAKWIAKEVLNPFGDENITVSMEVQKFDPVTKKTIQGSK